MSVVRVAVDSHLLFLQGIYVTFICPDGTDMESLVKNDGQEYCGVGLHFPLPDGS